MHYVLVTTEGAVCTITLNRPAKRNAVHGPMAAELRTAFFQFEENPSLSVAVLTGAGGNFCAGHGREFGRQSGRDLVSSLRGETGVAPHIRKEKCQQFAGRLIDRG